VTTNIPDICQGELDHYVAHVKKLNPGKSISEIDVSLDEGGEYVNLNYKLAPVPFKRLRRITGYLASAPDRFNNAKNVELKDRVKHDSDIIELKDRVRHDTDNE
jgi:hypothetical protein